MSRRSVPLLGALVAAVLAVSGAAALAAPAKAAGPSTLVSSKSTGAKTADIMVHSASMNKDVPLNVIMPRDPSKPAPVLYLLNGAGGGQDAATWQNKTDIVKFFANKQAYVVIPMAGEYSYYTDWEKPDKKLGVNKWSTFLGKELPPVVNSTYNTTGKNTLAGISTSGTSVLDLAIEHPGLYKGIGAYSGCASTSSEYGRLFIRIVVEGRGEGDAQNMWGPYRSAGWRDHDPVIHAEKLRGLSLYLSSGSGFPGPHENLREVPDPLNLIDQVGVGGVIEGATRFCTDQMASRLAQLHIPATYDNPPVGTHSWGYWQDELHRSWPQLAKAMR